MTSAAWRRSQSWGVLFQVWSDRATAMLRRKGSPGLASFIASSYVSCLPVCLGTSASFIGFMVNSSSRQDASTPWPPPTSVGGGGASVVPLSSGSPEGGHSVPEIVRVTPLPRSEERHGRDEGQEWVVESES